MTLDMHCSPIQTHCNITLQQTCLGFLLLLKLIQFAALTKIRPKVVQRWCRKIAMYFGSKLTIFGQNFLILHAKCDRSKPPKYLCLPMQARHGQ